MQLSIPELDFEPAGDDRAIIATVVGEQYDDLAEIISTGLSHLVSCNDTAKRARLIRLVAEKMIEESDRLGSAAGDRTKSVADTLLHVVCSRHYEGDRGDRCQKRPVSSSLGKRPTDELLIV